MRTAGNCACFSLSWGRGPVSPGIELRSADFSPLRSGPPKTAGSGLKSALLSGRNWRQWGWSLSGGGGVKMRPDRPLFCFLAESGLLGFLFPMPFEMALQHRAQVEEFRRKHRTELLTEVFTEIVG